MTVIDDNESKPESPVELEQLEIDSESAVEIEDAIREALEAVEQTEGEGGEDEEDSDLQATDLEAEVAELRERSMRTLADFENYRKRIQRERTEEARYANVPIIKEFLTVVDNLERAQVAEGAAEDLQKGVELILQQMEDLIRRFGVTRIDADGQEFDPNLHEAVSREEEADVEVPTVVEEFQPGYQIHDRLLRPAIVRVAMPVSADEAAEPQEAADDEVSS
jgi:molecular chaperone GrpE